ncbi:hypothetical protein F9U64_06260 [Gracilibacillus oryzae]|uniref:Uncharacterized protein n=1 Tax=Gracilibacillus oryzae TaxID=1672701 RepID=A0A7C8GUC4_9BACI|nr:hypothetical protein [Gracilibacillus oryzae]KAB8138142.1 hypothetical protein F9U64_06260 [Gracilibacillus oryzae]
MKQRIILLCLLIAGLTACDEGQIDGQKYTEESKQALTADQFQEYHILNQTIDLQNLTQIIVEDNASKRVILFETELGEEIYKSIYIKETSRLKIIHLGEKGLIFNETIMKG